VCGGGGYLVRTGPHLVLDRLDSVQTGAARVANMPTTCCARGCELASTCPTHSEQGEEEEEVERERERERESRSTGN